VRDAVLALHVTSGALGLILGLAAMLVERAPRYRSTFGFAFVAAVLVVAISAAGLVAFDPGGLWWLLPLAALAYGLAHLGYQAPCPCA
jgi:fatty acid desaturase